MNKTARTSLPIESLLAERWSPRAFAADDVSNADVTRLFEAARWAASCFNEQPWRFLIASRTADPAGHERLASCLVEANASWAQKAPVLAITVAKSNFTRNDRPNRHSWHDLGLAVGNLTLQAQAMGLAVHQMAGIDGAKARETLRIPEGFEPVTGLAIGRMGSPDSLPEELAAREREERDRLPMHEIVFGADWGQNAPSLET